MCDQGIWDLILCILNMHKTFATPHGSGGPGSGPIAVSAQLKPYLPVPLLVKTQSASHETYAFEKVENCPRTIGRLSTFMGNIGVLLRAYIYIRILGENGLKQVAAYSTLNANYLMVKLKEIGYSLAFPSRLAAHEFILTLSLQAKTQGVSAMDVAKRLLDEGFYAPTVYFPLLFLNAF